MSARATCPHCGRDTSIKDGSHTWTAHLLPGVQHSFTQVASIGDRYCPMSDQRALITGTDSTAYRRRATQVCDLAEQVHDRDPHVVWAVLTTIPADELRRLLMVALAGIDTRGKSVDDVFAWVHRGALGVSA